MSQDPPHKKSSELLAKVGRRDVMLGLLGAPAALAMACQSKTPSNPVVTNQTSLPRENTMSTSTSSSRMPVLFVGHGSPMNSFLDNEWSQGFADLTKDVPQPKAIVVISAHWYLDGSYLTGNEHPETIHDFYGFPKPLYEIQYPAPGSPDLARKIRTMLELSQDSVRTDWGLDHGTWSVLRWMYPDAKVPVLQLSLNRHLSLQQHFDLGRSLAPLRDEGILIVGSGNIVHNLRDAISRRRTDTPQTPDWAASFDRDVTSILQQRDSEKLVGDWIKERNGQLSHPTPDHWLPMLYTYAASSEQDQVSFPIEGFDLGSISMRSVLWKG